MASEVPKADWPSAMQSIKSAIGIGSPAKTEVADETEPVSGKTGEGTATEPYDAGNKEDNIDDGEFKDAHESVEPEHTAESAAVSPVTAAASDKVIETSDISPIKSEANTTDVTAPDGDIKPAEAKAADEEQVSVPTTSASETTAAKTGPSNEKANDAAVGATAGATAAGATAAAVAASSKGSGESKDAKPALKSRASSGIGSPGWFKNALQRRKSKGDNLKQDKGSSSTSTATPVAVPTSGAPLKETAKPAEESKAAETSKTVPETTTADAKPAEAPVSSTEKPAETTAAAVPVATASKPVEPAKPAEEKKTVAAAAPVETKKTETKSPKSDSKPAKSHERKPSDAKQFFKSVNPFKKRESKAGLAEEKEKKPETKSSEKKAVETGAVAGAATGATVAAAEAKKDDTKPNAVESSTTPADVKATNDITDTPSKEAAAPTSTEPAATTSTETKAPNHIPSDPPAGAAEPAPAVSTSTDPKNVESVAWQPASSSKAAMDDDIAPDQTVPTDSTSDPVKVEEPTKSTAAEPAVAASSSKAVPDDNIAPETKIPTDETSEPAKNVPRIEEPAEASSSDKGKGKETYSSSGGKNENVSAIPTAGGIRLGQRASEDRDVRRRSFASGDIASSSASTRAPTVNGTSKPLEPIKDDVAEKSETKTTTPSKPAPAKEEKSDATPNRRASVFGRLKNKVKS